ncbi:MAG: hypothetical protein ACFFAN_08705, partial [Promethearchaeota archaeon]
KEAHLKEMKPDIEKSAKAIEPSVFEKAFRIAKQREENILRQSIKSNVKGIGEKLESKIEKIEQQKKEKSN